MNQSYVKYIGGGFCSFTELGVSSERVAGSNPTLGIGRHKLLIHPPSGTMDKGDNMGIEPHLHV